MDGSLKNIFDRGFLQNGRRWLVEKSGRIYATRIDCKENHLRMTYIRPLFDVLVYLFRMFVEDHYLRYAWRTFDHFYKVLKNRPCFRVGGTSGGFIEFIERSILYNFNFFLSSFQIWKLLEN